MAKKQQTRQRLRPCKGGTTIHDLPRPVLAQIANMLPGVKDPMSFALISREMRSLLPLEDVNAYNHFNREVGGKLKDYVKQIMSNYVPVRKSIEEVTTRDILNAARGLGLSGPVIDELKEELEKLSWIIEETDDIYDVILRLYQHIVDYRRNGKGDYQTTIYYEALKPVVLRAINTEHAKFTNARTPLSEYWALISAETTTFMELMQSGLFIRPRFYQLHEDDEIRVKLVDILFACWDRIKVILQAPYQETEIYYDNVFAFVRVAIRMSNFVQKYYRDLHYVIIHFINGNTKALVDMYYAAYIVFPTLRAMRQDIGKMMTADEAIMGNKTVMAALTKIHRNVESLYFKCLRKMAAQPRRDSEREFKKYIRLIYKCTKSTFLTTDEKDKQFKSAFDKIGIQFTMSPVGYDEACVQ